MPGPHEKNSKHPTQFRCDNCKRNFPSSPLVRKHILAEHKSYKPCTKFFAPESNCKYGDKCHFSHTEVAEGKLRCYTCGTEASGIDEIMSHRKDVHKQACRNALTNTCKFDQDTCYLNHPSVLGETTGAGRARPFT